MRVGDSCQPPSPEDATAQAQLTRKQDLDSPNPVGADKASEAAPENPGRSLVRLFRVDYLTNRRECAIMSGNEKYLQ